MIAVVKIGTSSVTMADGAINTAAITKLAGEVAAARQGGAEIVVVSSGAVTAGVAALAPGGERPSDPVSLQAMSSIGQHRLMAVYDEAFAQFGLHVGQMLLVPANLAERRSYLRAKATMSMLLELGVIPIVNENDPVADDELRFGDNDRLAALVANLISAQVMVLLTDTAGLFDADPRTVKDATLVEQIDTISAELEAAAGGAGTPGGSGGMASKLAAGRMASWSGVRTVIAAAYRNDVVADALAGRAGVGTVIAPSPRRVSARKAWIAFALSSKGAVVVDDGARRALLREASLLPAGVLKVVGNFAEDEAIEIRSESGEVFAKGIARLSSDHAADWLGKRLAELPPDMAHELVGRDDLVVLA